MEAFYVYQNDPYEFWLQSDQNSKLSPLAWKATSSIQIWVCKWKWFSFISAVRLNRLNMVLVSSAEVEVEIFLSNRVKPLHELLSVLDSYVYFHHKISPECILI